MEILTHKPGILEKGLKQAAIKLLVCACLWLTGSMTHFAQAHTEDDLLLKAAFIYNFAKFTQWPSEVFQEQTSPLNLCITGEDELVKKLEQLAGKTIQQHPVVVQDLQQAQKIEDCQILYVAMSEDKNFLKILSPIRNQPVLTISELPLFAQSGGIIKLYKEKEQTHFIINLAASRQSGLEINSRLLKLAKVINHETVK